MDDVTRTTQGVPMQPPAPGPNLPSWGTFDICEKVGQGAFGEVFRAFDRTLQREVALKLLLPSGLRKDYQAQSILHEARQLAKVRHPNVVSIYGVDEHDGRVGFWSDFVHGQTLSSLLATQGPFGAREAAGIVIDFAKAVSAVHAAGLLHRDIKAGNAMREVGGRIMLMDFGLTQARNEGGNWGGTPGYMAPELWAGRDASVSSDIYALGVLLFHLLTRKYPFEVTSVSRTEGARGDPPRRRLLDERPDLPESLASVVETATHIDPAQRYRSAGELIAALSEAMNLGPQSVAPSMSGPVAPPVPERFWKTWMLAPLLGLLGLAAYLGLRPTGASIQSSSSSAYGTYTKAQDYLDHYYRPQGINQAIQLFEKTIAEDPKFALAYAGLARAHFLEYRQLRDPKHVEPAQAAATKALAIDRNLASVHVTLGDLYTETGRNDLAAQELNEALRLDARSAEAHHGLAELYYRQGRTSDAEAEFQKAIDLAPDDWRFPNEMGIYYIRTGQMEKAVAVQREAVRLAPDNPRAITNLGLALRRSGKTREAIDAYQRAIAIEPGFNRYSNLGVALDEDGRPQEAVEAYRKAIALNPSTYFVWGNFGQALTAIRGHETEARAALEKAIALGEKLRQTDSKNPTLLADLGRYYALVGNAVSSLPLLRQAVALDPEDPEVLYRCAQGQELLHRRPEALELIGKALKRGLALLTVERNADLAGLRADPLYTKLVGPLSQKR